MAIEIQITTVETTVLVDDLTGKEIIPGTGWVLTGLDAEDGDPVHHFQSLSNLLKALATKAEDVFDMTTDESVQRMAGLKIVDADAYVCDGDC